MLRPLDKHITESMKAEEEQPLVENTFFVKNKLGMHARPAALFVRKARQFSSDIMVETDGKKANGKNITEIIALTLAQGSRMTIRAKGVDAPKALKELGEMVNKKFGEK